MASKEKKVRLTILTLAISLCFHAVLLAAATLFGISDYQPSPTTESKPSAKIQAVKNLIESPKLLPIPKVRRQSTATETANRPPALAAEQANATAITTPINESIKTLASSPSYEPLENTAMAATEFFGAEAKKKKICYVVDSSGSMQGIFLRVKQRLKSSINNLMPNQYFSIIFFGNDQLYEFSSAKMTRAYPVSKAKAFNFIDSVNPGGKTNAPDALKKAFSVKDSLGDSPEVIYLLTDGFDLTETAGSYYFSQAIEKQRKTYCPKTIINTIGFWTKPSDCVILADIAENSQGSFTLIAKPKIERYIEIE
ncbi:MAG: VWA domain-containing protein [Anaerohalosphaeraceae bacterium]|nr:VWA domain-containing protein [Anaerohalosphaeraceae bacterium]